MWGRGMENNGARELFHKKYFMETFLCVYAWVYLAGIQINLPFPFRISQGSCNSISGKFWLFSKENVYSDIVIKIEGTSATKRNKSPLSLCLKMFLCPCDYQAFDIFSVGTFWIPSKIYDISSLCGESSIASFYKHISKTGKKKIRISVPIHWPCFWLLFVFCFSKEKREREQRGTARLILILSLEWLAIGTGYKNFVLASHLEQEV